MTAPGWYNAEGDPAGTQRYWDGSQWVGEPVFETPGATAAPPMADYGGMPAPTGPAYGSDGGFAYAGAAASRFPSGLKTLAIIVSVLKAIPLVLGIVGFVIIAFVAEDFDDEFDAAGIDVGGVLGAALAIFAVFLIIGALLLGFQFWGAIKERNMMVFVPALIMSIIDVLLMLSSWASVSQDGPLGALIMTAVTAAQIYVAVWAIRSNN